MRNVITSSLICVASQIPIRGFTALIVSQYIGYHRNFGNNAGRNNGQVNNITQQSIALRFAEQ